MKDDYIRFRLTSEDKEQLQRNIERDGYDTMSQWLIDAIRNVTLHRPSVSAIVTEPVNEDESQ